MSEAASGEAAPAPAGLGVLRSASLTAGVALAIVGAVTLGLGPLLYRMGVLDLPASTAGVERWAMLIFAGSGVFALIGLIVSLITKKHRGAIVGVLVLAAAGTGGGSLYGQSVLRDELPPIYDLQTDWSQPVAFTEAALRTREAAGAVHIRDDAMIPEGESKWSGKSFAEAQQEVYELEPLIVRATAPDATVAAANAAKRLGWDVMLSDPQEGQLEAVSRSFWYGLAYDIAVRVTPQGDGARVDVRSTSRTPGGDVGANAGQIKEFLDEVALELR